MCGYMGDERMQIRTIGGKWWGILHQNPANYVYVFCCRPYDFVVEQCSLLETKVFKNHASKQFESAVGDVGHCNYDRGSCHLEDQSMLVWRSYSCRRPLAEKATGWICKFSAREEFFMQTSQQPLTGSHGYWTYFEQAGTNGTPT